MAFFEAIWEIFTSDSTYVNAALFAGLFVGGCSVYDPPSRAPDVRLLSLQPERIGLKRQSFRLNLSLSNIQYSYVQFIF